MTSFCGVGEKRKRPIERTGFFMFCPGEKWGESQNKKEGPRVEEGKEGRIHLQTNL